MNGSDNSLREVPMSSKPDKKQVKLFISRTRQIDSWLKAALDGQKEELAQLRKAADQFVQSKFQAALGAMDVDMLAQGKSGIRISYLRSAGIQNIFQLSQKTQAQIEALEGIGPQGAEKISR